MEDSQQCTQNPDPDGEQGGGDSLRSQHNFSIRTSASANDERQQQTISVPVGGNQVESKEQQLSQVEEQSETNIGRDAAQNETQRLVEDDFSEHHMEERQHIDGLPREDGQLETGREQPEQVQGQVPQADNMHAPYATSNSGENQELQQRQGEDGQSSPLQQDSSEMGSQFPDRMQGENPVQEQVEEIHLKPPLGQQPEQDDHEGKDIHQDRHEIPTDKAQLKVEIAQVKRNNGGLEANAPTNADPAAHRHTRRPKTSKRTKKPQDPQPAFDANAEKAAALKETPRKRATEVLFDVKTAMALKSLCALQVNVDRGVWTLDVYNSRILTSARLMVCVNAPDVLVDSSKPLALHLPQSPEIPTSSMRLRNVLFLRKMKSRRRH